MGDCECCDTLEVVATENLLDGLVCFEVDGRCCLLGSESDLLGKTDAESEVSRCQLTWSWMLDMNNDLPRPR